MGDVEIYIKGSYIPRDERMCVNVLIKAQKKEVSRYFEIKGKGSAIEAEYIGLVKIISTLRRKLQKKDLTFLKIYTINEVIVKQLGGEYRVSTPRILPLYSELKKQLQGLNYQVMWLSRSEMDAKIKSETEFYNDKQLREMLNKIDFDEEDLWL